MSQSPKHPDPADVYQWEHGWDEHERMQIQRLARLPFADKLAWLEQAHRVAMRLKAAHSARTNNTTS